MKDLNERLAKLTPDQRALLEKRLRERGLTAPRSSAIPRIPNRESLPYFPASFDQERLWFIDQMEPGNPAYNIHTTTRLKGPMDPARMKRAVNAVIARHEVLRTTFEVVDGRPVQVVAPVLEIDLPVVDLTSVPEAEREAAAQHAAVQAASVRFDLRNGPLVQVMLARLAPEDHVMMICMQHAITDRWSFDVFEREVGQVYVALRDGVQPDLPELPIQFADFAVWQREELSGESGRRHVEYWRNQLRGAPMVLEIAAERPRPPVQTFHGAREYVTYPEGLRLALRALTKECGATMFMTMMAALDVLCWKYSGQRDLVIGSAIIDRNRPETENVIGYFLNMLLLRATIDPKMTFRDLILQAREAALGAYAHQEVPFATLVAELKPRQDVSRNPLMQISFIYLDFELLKTPEELGFTSSSFDVDNGASRVDMTLACWELPGEGLHSYIEYNTDLYDGAKVHGMLAHLRRILETGVAGPDRPLSEMAVLAEEERASLAAGLVAEKGDAAGLLHEDVADSAARQPEAPAVVQRGVTLTYRELDERGTRIARRLAALGIGPGDQVPVRAETATALATAALGVLRAGAAYAPIDPALPDVRVAHMLVDLHPRVILAESHLKDLPRTSAQVVSIEEAAESPGASGSAREVTPSELTGEVTPRDQAYVIFTSGSTGVPKGVVLSHGAIANQMRWSQAQFSLGPDDRVLQNAAFGFDVAVWELFAPLRAGATLVAPTEDERGDPSALVRLLHTQRITVMACVPALLRAMLDERDFASGLDLRLLFLGGEPMDAALAERCRRVLPNCRIVHLYGPTEAAVTSLFQECTADLPEGRISLGRPVAGLSRVVLDDMLHPSPLGVPGELCLGGVGLADGYLERPDLTAERFLPDPFSKTPGARLYRTGDRVKHRMDGSLEFLGRIDHQVKVRGYRIETGEIETALEHIPGIERSVAMARAENGGSRLVAYVVANGNAPSDAEMRAALRSSLPEYMVPSTFVALDALPLNANGKVDRASLPEPGREQASNAPWVAPRTPVEEAIAEVWQSVLQRDRVGAHDDFFELGGDSLLATQVVARVKAAFQIELPLRRFFLGSQLSALAATVDEILVAKIESMSDEEAARLLSSARPVPTE